MAINIKIVGKDELSSAILVKCNTDKSLKNIEEYPAYAFAADHGGATDVETFLEAIKESCRDFAFQQDQKETQEPVDTTGWANKEITYDTIVSDLTLSDFEKGKEEIFKIYPPANMDSIRKLLNTTYPNMHLDPLIRWEDAVTIGVYVNGYGGFTQTEKSRGLLSVKQAAQDAAALGVPMFGGTVPREGDMTRVDFENFLRKTTPYNEFISMAGAGYVYQPWVLDLAKNRKLTIINSERNKKEAGGFTYMGKVLDSDAKSVARITTAALTAKNALEANEPYTVEWTAQDNSIIVMSATDVVGMPKALAAHAQELHAEAKNRKEAVKLAATFEEVEAA